LRNQLKKKYRIILSHLFTIKKESINTYLEKKKHKIQELLGEDYIKTAQIHKLRKQLKILNYNKEILSAKKKQEKFSKQDVLPELLGKWHDCKVIINHLEKALNRGQLPLMEVDQLKTIQSKIVYEGDVLLNEIKNTITATGVLGNKN